jgi:thiol-disulfide isomerase/thioredoxin
VAYSIAPEVRGNFSVLGSLTSCASWRRSGISAARSSRLIPEDEAWKTARRRGPGRPVWPKTAVIKATALLAGLAMLPGGTRAASLEPWTVGPSPMPPFELDALGGGRKALTSHRGHITLVHFFATWCEPCRQELPALDRFAASHRLQGLRVFAIDVGEVEPAVERFLALLPVAFPVLLDTDRAVTKAWEISTLPTTFLLDETLIPGQVAIGDVDWDAPTIDQLLDKISTPQSATHTGSAP